MSGFTVPGFAVGHWTHPTGRTGCTVILADKLALAYCDVRGGAPGTRETDLLRPGSLVRHLDAVLLAGGSAFGLAAAEGVVDWLRERGRGFPTRAIPVPIVSAAVIYDLTDSEPALPDREAGYRACATARPDGWQSGRFGAGTNSSVGKILGPERATPTGIGTGSIKVRENIIGALVVVNALGDIIDPSTGQVRAGLRGDNGEWLNTRDILLQGTPTDHPLNPNTTLVVIATDMALDHHALIRMATAAHDALARTIRPTHTLYDGDTVFILSRAEAPTSPGVVVATAAAVEIVVEQAVLAASGAP